MMPEMAIFSGNKRARLEGLESPTRCLEGNPGEKRKSFSETSFLKGTPEMSLMNLAKYPESLHCK